MVTITYAQAMTDFQGVKKGEVVLFHRHVDEEDAFIAFTTSGVLLPKPVSYDEAFIFCDMMQLPEDMQGYPKGTLFGVRDTTDDSEKGKVLHCIDITGKEIDLPESALLLHA